MQKIVLVRNLQNSLFCHSREVSGGKTKFDVHNPHCNHLKSWMPDKSIMNIKLDDLVKSRFCPLLSFRA